MPWRLGELDTMMIAPHSPSPSTRVAASSTDFDWASYVHDVNHREQSHGLTACVLLLDSQRPVRCDTNWLRSLMDSHGVSSANRHRETRATSRSPPVQASKEERLRDGTGNSGEFPVIATVSKHRARTTGQGEPVCRIGTHVVRQETALGALDPRGDFRDDKPGPGERPCHAPASCGLDYSLFVDTRCSEIDRRCDDTSARNAQREGIISFIGVERSALLRSSVDPLSASIEENELIQLEKTRRVRISAA